MPGLPRRAVRSITSRGYAQTRDRSVGGRSESLARQVIDDVENPEAAPIGRFAQLPRSSLSAGLCKW